VRFGSVPTLKSPKIEQNRRNWPKSASYTARRLRINYGASLARNVITECTRTSVHLYNSTSVRVYLCNNVEVEEVQPVSGPWREVAGCPDLTRLEPRFGGWVDSCKNQWDGVMHFRDLAGPYVGKGLLSLYTPCTPSIHPMDTPYTGPIHPLYTPYTPPYIPYTPRIHSYTPPIHPPYIPHTRPITLHTFVSLR